MARKIKQGLDYFPHNCILDDDLEYIIAEHHEIGYYVYFRLLEKIYHDEGYYMLANKRNIILYANKINVDISIINVIINSCLDEGLFNKNLFINHNILTSSGIQDRYIEAVTRRKEVYFISDYLLLDIEDVNIKLKNVNINYLNADKSTQSKVNKSKVDKSKVKHCFKESPYFENFDLFKKDIGELFHKYDLKYYYQKLEVSGDKYKYEDWVQAAKNWIMNDEKENKAVLQKISVKNEIPDTTLIDDARKKWNAVIMDVSKEVSKKDEYTNYLDLSISSFENNILIMKVSKKEIFEKINKKLLTDLILKHFGQIQLKIIIKN